MENFSLENLSSEWGLSVETKNYLRNNNIKNMNGNILEELKIFRQNTYEHLPSTIRQLEKYLIECYGDFIIFTRDEKLYIINSIINQLQLFVLRIELIIFLLEAQNSLANNGNLGIVLGALGSNYNIISCLISAITVIFKKTSNNTSSLDWKSEMAPLNYKIMNKAWAYALVEGNIQNYNGFSGHQDNTKVVIIERMVLQNLALFEI
uniref:Uncharacterized protein n=2 Tax=Meloidogyne TaxID=189290 RepID=A0A6V7V636_MELEN|nr:unnamed protein product [Meloidogyne enterolobii]